MSGFLPRDALQVAQHQWYPIFVRQSAQFPIKDRPEFRPHIDCRLSTREGVHLLPPPFHPRAACFERCAIGHAVEPVAHLAAWPDAVAATHEDKESSLESVLGVVAVAQDAPADAQHHRTMPVQQSRERRLIAPAKKSARRESSLCSSVSRRPRMSRKCERTALSEAEGKALSPTSVHQTLYFYIGRSRADSSILFLKYRSGTEIAQDDPKGG